MNSSNIFKGDKYKLVKKPIQIIGKSFKIYDADENMILFSEAKAFKLKEDIRVYSDESKSEEILSIQARQIIDFSANYDVVDSKTGKAVGTLQRKGLKSILRDEWLIKDTNDNEIGKLQEDKPILALIRRLITPLIPQSYDVTMGEELVAEFDQNFNPFMYKLTLNMHGDKMDRRIAIAAAILLAAIEGKQN